MHSLRHMHSLRRPFTLGLIWLLLIAPSGDAVNFSLGGGGFGAFVRASTSDSQESGPLEALRQTDGETEVLNGSSTSGIKPPNQRNEVYGDTELRVPRKGYGYRSVRPRSLIAAQSGGVVTVNPGIYQTPDSGQGGTLAVTGISNTGHGSTGTGAGVSPPPNSNQSSSQARSARWSSFQSGGPFESLTLKFDWTANGNVQANTMFASSASANIAFVIQYSIDGGSSWTTKVTKSRSVFVGGDGSSWDSINNESGSEVVVLSPSQDISQVQVRDHMDASASAGTLNNSETQASASASITTNISRIRLEAVPVNCFANVPGDQLKGEYYNNTTLSGSPAMVRNDGAGLLNFNFGEGGPGSPCIPVVDNFSARWTRTVNFAAGTYRFTTAVDNGVRLYIDDQLKIDKWGNLPPNTYTADVPLSAAPHVIRLEFVEYVGDASASLSWTDLNCLANVPVDRWKGEYYNNITLSGNTWMVRNDGDGLLSFNFGNGGPGGNCGLGVDNFSVRWTRTVNFAPGIYRFSATADDGVRLYVDGQLKIDKWFSQGATTYTADVALSGLGPHQVRLEYFDGGGPGVAILSWTTVGGLSCLPDLPLIGAAPRTVGGESIATTATSQPTKSCGQKKSD